MSKMNEMEMALSELCAALHNAQEAAQNIRALLGSEPAANAAPAKPARTTKATKAAPAPKTYTLEEIRAVLLEKRKAGFKDEIKALLAAHGAEKLTDIAPAEYTAMMKEAEAIGA